MDLYSESGRKDIIQQTKNPENVYRKNKSVREYQIYNDKIKTYVKEYLVEQFDNEFIKKMPIVSTINLSRRIVNQEASIYKQAPTRVFSSNQEDFDKIYKDMTANVKLFKSNIYYRLQGQSCIYMVPSAGKLDLRVLLMHHFDVIPDPNNPEVALAYIVSAYDYTDMATYKSDKSNEQIGDKDDVESVQNMFVVWTKTSNFIMNQYGNVISENNENFLGLNPFVDIFWDKDFQYFVDRDSSTSDFTVQYNAALSDVGQIVRAQGFAQAVMSGPPDLMPDNISIGPTTVIRLPVDPNNPDAKMTFDFVTPSPDIAGSISYVELLLSNYLSSRGVDPKLVSGTGESSKYSSGMERLLSMIEKLDATQEDYEVYARAEDKIFELVKKYVDVYGGTELLPDYKFSFPDDTKMNVTFAKPTAVLNDDEKLSLIERRRDAGLISDVEAIAIDRGISKEDAKLVKAELNSEKSDNLLELMNGENTEPETNAIRG